MAMKLFRVAFQDLISLLSLQVSVTESAYRVSASGASECLDLLLHIFLFLAWKYMRHHFLVVDH